LKLPQFSLVLPPARRADACRATHRSCCVRRLSFGWLRGAQLGLARRVVPGCKGQFSTRACATRS
ncbi:hypothetical protein A2U01_0068588, partial [Trifolium medium]|nr:hypothetical protein [Trifolium medium]